MVPLPSHRPASLRALPSGHVAIDMMDFADGGWHMPGSTGRAEGLPGQGKEYNSLSSAVGSNSRTRSRTSREGRRTSRVSRQTRRRATLAVDSDAHMADIAPAQGSASRPSARARCDGAGLVPPGVESQGHRSSAKGARSVTLAASYTTVCRGARSVSPEARHQHEGAARVHSRAVRPPGDSDVARAQQAHILLGASEVPLAVGARAGAGAARPTQQRRSEKPRCSRGRSGLLVASMGACRRTQRRLSASPAPHGLAHT